MNTNANADPARAAVRSKYARVARRAAESPSSDECGGSCAAVRAGLYTLDQRQVVPESALEASLGCGNPTALASLAAGEVVLDLGSGGGIDVLLAARSVGPTGFVYGLDMTDEMLALAQANLARQGARNVAFLKGYTEAIPLVEDAVDVVISNCVINLSTDKGAVLREAFRVLKSGGRLAVADVVVQGALPGSFREEMEARVGCVAGALEEGEYRRLLAAAGFADIEIEVTRVYDVAPSPDGGDGGASGRAGPAAKGQLQRGRVVSAFIRARKPPIR